ncbi:MAG: nucleotidyl transferase AbiEii/AbiGii toxin family protein [Victivallaceae bacterium]|nr:nucleotidyl transferase AbiEii/AbiGii toxin family protein [Victivallaceae bacterium]
MKIEKFESQEHLLAYVMDLIGDKLASNAILKGGMVLRLTDSPRLTNDLDYVFTPFKSKKDIVEILLDCLKGIPGVSCSHNLNSKCLRIVLSTENNISVQIEANVMQECLSSTMTTQVLAKKYGLPPRIIRIMSFEIALANKLAAWCERRLIRDIFDIYYISAVLNKKPDLDTLKNRLKKLNFARNVDKKTKSMTLEEFTTELEICISELTGEEIEKELGGYFAAEELPGLEYIIGAGVSKLINWLKEQTVTQQH